MKADPSIVLTGPPGSGKSAVGRALADLLHRPFIDMDTEIAVHLGRPIADIFSTDGEEAFRDAESSLLLDLSSRSGLVIASGGGTLLRPSNREALASSILVNLTAPAEELLRRLSQKNDRPLLSGDAEQTRTKLLALLEERRSVYDGVPVQVDTSGLDPVEVARRIAGLVGT